MNDTKKAVFVVSISIMIIILLFVSLQLYAYNIAVANGLWTKLSYLGWKDVYITETWGGSVPNEWVVTRDDNILYITDKPMDEYDYTTYIVGMIGATKDSEGFFAFLSELYDGEVTYFVGDTQTFTNVKGLFSNDLFYRGYPR